MSPQVTHTPLPWRFSWCSQHVITAEDGKQVIATVGEGSTHPATEDQNTANAALIRAAPELLAALEGLTEWVQNNFEGEDSGPYLEDWKPVDDAIAAAKGLA